MESENAVSDEQEQGSVQLGCVCLNVGCELERLEGEAHLEVGLLSVRSSAGLTSHRTTHTGERVRET